MADILFDWFGFSCFVAQIYFFGHTRTSETGGDTSLYKVSECSLVQRTRNPPHLDCAIHTKYFVLSFVTKFYFKKVKKKTNMVRT